ncbi:MAG: HD-GYP domain-containing protein [Lachnospiraceae bacterium]|nr:HD-GYP domain-containing protein [Lachnospiraceae bacterium]
MRRSKLTMQNQISILTVDDDPIITSTIKAYFNRSGYEVDIENDPVAAIERVRNGAYDIMLLDFLMSPICGDQVVEEIRKFNKDIYIVLLTGHKSMAPPVRTIRQLDIQGYYEKDERFDQLELLVESCVKSIRQMRTIREYQMDLSKAYMQTIETLRYVVETRDKETKGHSERVSGLSVGLAKEMGLPEAQVEMIRVAGLFHDIGKIGVPDAILLKNGPLNDEEFMEIKKHPAEGEKILQTYSPFKELLPIVRGHHERFDGRGYPDRLAGEDICLGARVIAVADSFDAMISNRTYRRGLGFERTIEELNRGRNTQFDESVVDALLQMIERLGREQFEEQYCAHNRHAGE